MEVGWLFGAVSAFLCAATAGPAFRRGGAVYTIYAIFPRRGRGGSVIKCDDATKCFGSVQVPAGYTGPLLNRTINSTCIQIPNELPNVISVAATGVDMVRPSNAGFVVPPGPHESGGVGCMMLHLWRAQTCAVLAEE